MYTVYSLLLTVGFFLALPWFLWKGRSTGKYLRTFSERMGRLPVYLNVDGDRAVWIHAVSVGEVLAARPLVPLLRERLPSHRIFLSTTTMTGSAVARKAVRGVDGLFYAPFDFAHPVRHALAVLNPSLLVLIETELWPNLIHEACRRGTRVAVVNGRISPRSFRRYLRARRLVGRVLSEVDLFLMQGEAHAERIRALGAPAARVQVTGNLKFDAVEPGRVPERLARLLQGAPGAARPLWIAGSTVTGEEELVLSAFHRVRRRVPEARLLVAPRHPERFDAVLPLVEEAGFRCLRRSALDPLAWQDGEVMLLDTLGELSQLYALANVVFVGGSLLPSGGHNILEPAVAGKPVIVGPHMENFQEIADQFREAQAMLQVGSADELGDEVASLLLDDGRRLGLGERARALVGRNRGAVGRSADALVSLLS
ncbi:MAG TPA: 3-deoxy-D-manno-octulosonic acid transferase [Vicinamibacteria bacterium]|nr:3-deoxy-D-manno-octulosonic acid transferase [Vicinamibacteria bacterium]